jgi:hypothetical protein
MRFEFLGPGRVLAPDGSVLLSGGLPFTLLAYLARHPEGVMREDLAVLFWPGRDRILAFQSLRQTLSRLRRALGEDCIIGAGSRIGIDLTGVDSDLEEFGQAIAAGDARGAVRLWDGGFLSDVRGVGGWEVEAWLDRERARLTALLRSTLLDAGQRILDGIDPPSEFEVLLAGVRWFPYDSALLLLQLDLEVALGRRKEAAALIEELRSWIDEEQLQRREVVLADALHRDPPPAVGVLSPPEVPGRIGLRVHRGWGIAAVLLIAVAVMAAGVSSISTSLRDQRLRDHVLVYCYTDGTLRTPGVIAHLSRMDLDGRNKHRVSDFEGCSSLWLKDAGVAVLIPGPVHEQVPVRLSPSANPIAEWEFTPLRFVEGATLRHPEFQGDLPQFDGRYAILAGEVAPGDIRLFVLDPVADTVRLLTPDPGWHKEPVWDPDAREVIYSSNRGGTISLWAVDPFDPDAPHVQLTDSPTQDERAAVRNGRILFVRGFGVGETEGDYEIRMLDRRTGVEEVLVSRPWNDFMARWSPDGTHICWTSTEFGHFESDIWVMNVATRKMRNLTTDLDGRSYECRWGPDSRTVFFSSLDSGRTQIYRVSRTGRGMQNISRSAAEVEPWAIVPRSMFEPAPR